MAQTKHAQKKPERAEALQKHSEITEKLSAGKKNKGKDSVKEYTYKETGRPSTITEAVIAKLEAAYAFDCNTTEACAYAGISEAAYYRWVKQNPDFREKKKRLRENPILIAKQSVIKNMSKDGRLALQFLKARRPKQYSEKVQLDLGKPIKKISIEVLEHGKRKRDQVETDEEAE